MRRVKILKLFFVIVLFIVFVVYANFAIIKAFFLAAMTFNIAVISIFTLGMMVMYQSGIKLTMLAGTFGTLAYKKGKDLEIYLAGITKLLPPTVAHMLSRRAKKGVLLFSATEIKDVTQWLDNLFFQQKNYTTFFVNVALLFGLFGTFTGLLVAIDEMGAVILSFGGNNVDIGEIMTGFSGPLSGMAIGFASSLFGVTSAIILNIMQYLLGRSQASFIEDVEDWMKGKMIEAQSIEAIERGESIEDITSSLRQSSSGSVGNNSAVTMGFLDVFVDTMSDFADKMEKSNNLIEGMFERVSTKIDGSLNKTDEETILLRSMLEILKESNVNQYSNTKIVEESLQEIANVILAEHKVLKRNAELQEENNKLLLEVINNLKMR